LPQSLFSLSFQQMHL